MAHVHRWCCGGSIVLFAIFLSNLLQQASSRTQPRQVTAHHQHLFRPPESDVPGSAAHVPDWALSGLQARKVFSNYAVPLLDFCLAMLACYVVYASRIRPKPGVFESPAKGFFGLQSRLQVGVFVAYVVFSCGHMFLQHRAGRTGYSPIAAAVLIYLMKCLVACVMHFSKTGMSIGNTFCAALEPVCVRGTFGGKVPIILLCMVPGGCLAVYDALSFISLAKLDPVTYQIFLHVRLVFIALLWQCTFQRQLSRTQWFALVLFAMASSTKALEKITYGGISWQGGLVIVFVQLLFAVVGNISSELLLKELPVATDLLNICMYSQGLVALLISICITQGGPRALVTHLLSTSAWQALYGDPWMISSIVCLTAFGIVTAYFLRELSNLLKELSACFVIMSSAAVEWGILQSSSYSLLGIQAVTLAILAVGVYNVEPLDNSKKHEVNQLKMNAAK